MKIKPDKSETIDCLGFEALDVVIQVPAHSCGQVAGLRLQPLEPLPVPRAAQRPIGLPDQGPVVLGVAMSDRGDVRPGGKPFGEERVDRVEHARPRPSIAGLEADHAVAGERLRQAIEKLVVEGDAGERIPVTASIGVASWNVGEPLESLVTRADQAMYASKRSGRNRVTVDEARPTSLPQASVA